jgi:flagellar export protein FliJ
MNSPRPCWSVLLTKSQEEVNRLQLALQGLRDRMNSLQASRERLLGLHRDYLRPPQAGDVSTGMLETLNRRQFADQIMTLIERVDQDKAQLERAMAQMRQRLLAAERERLKMQSLLEQDVERVKSSSAKREQRQLDDIGTVRFNLGSGG